MLALLLVLPAFGARTVPDACTVARTPAPGLAEAPDDLLELARLRMREARLLGDPGVYTLSDAAAACLLATEPAAHEATWLRAYAALQHHRFAQAEAWALSLTISRDHWRDQLILGDARAEQGDVEGAIAAWEAAMEARPGLETYDRIAWARHLLGDVAGAEQVARMAVGAGSPLDPEPLAWALSRLGWLHALQGEEAPELDRALELLPDYAPARLARGRLRLHLGHPGAVEDLRAAGRSVEAWRGRLWAGDDLDLALVAHQDPRGYATWLAPRDPAGAVKLLEGELQARQDAVTRAAWCWARALAGEPAQALEAELRAALATGTVEPRVLLHAGLVLRDAELLRRALASGPGLWPDEQALAREALEGL